MKHIILALAIAASLAGSASAAWPNHGRHSSTYGGYSGNSYSAPMHVYYWPNGTVGFDSPTITYGATPATVYSPWVYSPYSGGYGGYGYGNYGYGWGAGF